MEQVQYYQAQFDKELSKHPFWNLVEKQTGAPKVYVAGGLAAVTFILVFFNLFASLLTGLIGWTYPAYATFKAIESPGTEDDKQWLVYWAVIGFFNIIEYFSDALLYWVPFYYTIKTAALVWLMLPQTRGAEKVYNSYMRPLLLSFESQVHSLLEKHSGSAPAAPAADAPKSE